MRSYTDIRQKEIIMGSTLRNRIRRGSRYVVLLRLRVLLRYENAQQGSEKMSSQRVAEKMR
jgi:hypothetical protein